MTTPSTYINHAQTPGRQRVILGVSCTIIDDFCLTSNTLVEELPAASFKHMVTLHEGQDSWTRCYSESQFFDESKVEKRKRKKDDAFQEIEKFRLGCEKGCSREGREVWIVDDLHCKGEMMDLEEHEGLSANASKGLMVNDSNEHSIAG